MIAEIRLAFACSVACISLLPPPAQAAEPTDFMLTLARMFAALEARDLSGYCSSKFTFAYREYMDRVCESAVQNKVKTRDECSKEKIAQEIKSDADQCLAMSAAELEATVLRGVEGRKAFVSDMRTRGVDGEMLIQGARAKPP